MNLSSHWGKNKYQFSHTSVNLIPWYAYVQAQGYVHECIQLSCRHCHAIQNPILATNTDISPTITSHVPQSVCQSSATDNHNKVLRSAAAPQLAGYKVLKFQKAFLSQSVLRLPFNMLSLLPFNKIFPFKMSTVHHHQENIVALGYVLNFWRIYCLHEMASHFTIFQFSIKVN